MKILIYLGHPAHYHTVSHLLPKWAEEGYEPILVARDKDVLLQLLEGLPYRTHQVPSRKGKDWWSIFFSTLRREWRIYRLTLKERPAILIGTDITIAHAGYWTGTPSLLINEDDTEVVPKLAHLGFRYATQVLSPHSCNITPYEKKKLSYKGVHEIAYLHPRRFTPDREQVEELFADGKERYAIIRISALNAHHDKGIGGMTPELVRELIRRTEPHARPWISSEKELPEDLEPYRLSSSPDRIHHVLAFAELLVGDSQTMTAEAAVLGTPSVRYGDLVGRLGYLDALEKEHGLSFGFGTEAPEAMLEKVASLISRTDLKDEWERKRDAFLEEADDPTELIQKAVERAVDKTVERKKGGL
jgi:hypothetical protein